MVCPSGRAPASVKAALIPVTASSNSTVHTARVAAMHRLHTLCSQSGLTAAVVLQDIRDADAVILGAPGRQGGMCGEMRMFLDSLAPLQVERKGNSFGALKVCCPLCLPCRVHMLHFALLIECTPHQCPWPSHCVRHPGSMSCSLRVVSSCGLLAGKGGKRFHKRGRPWAWLWRPRGHPAGLPLLLPPAWHGVRLPSDLPPSCHIDVMRSQ